MNLLKRSGVIAALLFFMTVSLSSTAQVDSSMIPHNDSSNKVTSTKPNDSAAAHRMERSIAPIEIYYDAVKARILDDDKLADSLLRTVIKLAPTEPSAYYDMARLNIKHNQVEKALENINKAVELDGKNKMYRYTQAEILDNAGKYLQGADVLMQLAKEETHNEDYLYKAVDGYLREAKYRQTLEATDKLKPKTELNEGALYKKALEALDKLQVKVGADEEVFMQKEQIYEKMNDMENAEKTMYELIKLNPNDSRYYYMLGDLYNKNKRAGKNNEILNELKNHPNDAGIQYAIVQYYKNANDTIDYHTCLLKAIDNKDMDADRKLGLAIEYIQLHVTDSAKRNEGVSLIEKISDQNSDNAQLQAMYAYYLTLSNQYDKAIVQYKKSLKIDYSRFLVWRQLLGLYTEKKYADSLIVVSERAMHLFPNQAEVYYFNAIGYYNKKNYNAAVRSMNRAIDFQTEEDKDKLADIYSLLGDIYNSSHQYTLADSSFEKSLKLNSKNAVVLNNYSYYLSERGTRLDDAEKMSKRSLELSPGQATFLDTYGWILYKMGKYKKAKECVEKAINSNLQAADATLFEHLGDILFKLGENDKAVEYWKFAKEKGSENPLLDKKIEDKKLYE
jgi:tetratricopeptide (TPR) repeat protein